jgi:hypothetical protein
MRAAATFTCAGRLSWGLQLQHQSATLHSNAVATLVFHSNGTRPSSSGRDGWPRRRLNHASAQSCSRSSTAATHGQALLLHAASSADAVGVGGGEAAIQEAMCCEKREGDKVTGERRTNGPRKTQVCGWVNRESVMITITPPHHIRSPYPKL